MLNTERHNVVHLTCAQQNGCGYLCEWKTYPPPPCGKEALTWTDSFVQKSPNGGQQAPFLMWLPSQAYPVKLSKRNKVPSI
ncbi:mCG148292 [Mus musculus]|nr:mCG148292 [Mus musculus]